MTTQYLKQAEIFSFLAMMFLISLIVLEVTRQADLEAIIKQKEDAAATLEETKNKIRDAENAAQKEKEEVDKIRKERDDLVQRIRQLGPPIMILSDQDQRYHFPRGKATISTEFRQALETELIPWIEQQNQQAGGAFNAIEVIGHTDDVSLNAGASNIDASIIDKFSTHHLEELHPGSNMDLGAIRALAVIAILREHQQNNGSLPGIPFFFPYSAGQLLVNHQIAQQKTGDDAKRRRVEIRLLKYSETMD